MNKFSQQSATRLASCHPQLQAVFTKVLEVCDCSILCGHRTEQEQNALPNSNTQVRFPNSKHNSVPSKAVDATPYPYDEDDRERFSYFAGIVIGVGASMGVAIRWGGDWDRDNELKDNGFDDLMHFELVE
ncbi:M15 family peptidase [Aliivibrio fischeri]|uniref:M15 family peptidase n=1 Tax=Aliivibrio fischeri TaxID=668 RepID=UPI001B317A37|nr:M15 family peptidase [Aliivibrio fischeri]MBP3142233.1 M15 family peptidase [Aliivibrio fischeri]MBP3157140.1 M15 family peptidase [Aliivibrio fischeri]MCE7575209.1 M15 family peptidase [Aliivibrio fischeri]